MSVKTSQNQRSTRRTPGPTSVYSGPPLTDLHRRVLASMHTPGCRYTDEVARHLGLSERLALALLEDLHEGGFIRR